MFNKFNIFLVLIVLILRYLSYGFIEFYKPIPISQVVRPKRIVMSLTTTQERIGNIIPTLKSILNNTVKPDVIYIHIHSNVIVPQNILDWFVENQQNVPIIVSRMSNDYGSVSKLYPTLLRERDDETVIITIDDDIIYPSLTIQHLIQASHKYPEKCICISGWDYVFVGFFYIPVIHPFSNIVSKISVVQSDKGVLYKRRFFKDMSLIQNNLKKECEKTADIVVSDSLKKRGIDIYCIPMKSFVNINWKWKNDQRIKCLNSL